MKTKSISILFSLILLTIPIISFHAMRSYQEIEKSSESEYQKAVEINEDYSNITLSITLDDAASTVGGNLTIDYYNADALTITQIPFHIYPSGMHYHLRHGNLEVFNVTTDAEPKIILEYNVISSAQLMWVTLDAPLPPGERTQFTIEFLTTLPDGGLDRANSNGTDGELNRIYTFASAYPIPCVYDVMDGWNVDPYIQIGDPFYLDMAYYDVYLEVDDEFRVAATGELTDSIIIGDNVIHHYRASFPVREFTFAASKYFIIESQEANGVAVSTYYLPSAEQYWNETALLHGLHALELFNESFGNYPYSTLNVVESHGNFGGMEYPCQVYIAHSIIGWIDTGQTTEYYLELVIAHEIGHQWWYQLVGVDEVDQGFMDEGLTCWSHHYYAEVYHGSWDFFQYTKLWDYIRTYYSDTGLENKIDQSLLEFDDQSVYYYTAYNKAPLIFQKLRVFLGNEVFFDGLKLFFERFAFKNAFLADLVGAMEDASDLELDWFFDPWFENSLLPYYEFDSVVYFQNSNIVNITISDLNEDTNEFPYSQRVPLEIYAGLDTIYQDDVWINGTTSILIQLDDEPSAVSIMITNYVLVQLDDVMTSSISTDEITFTNSTSLTVTSEPVPTITTPSTNSSSSTTESLPPNDVLIPIIVMGIGLVILGIAVLMIRRR